jgi:hypothetical protein
MLMLAPFALWGAYKIGKSFIETWDEIGKAQWMIKPKRRVMARRV